VLKLIIACRRNPALSRQEFAEYHTGPHAKLVYSVPEFAQYLRKYQQNHIIMPATAFGLYGGADDHTDRDVIASLWFDSIATLQQAFNEPKYLEVIRPDEMKFADLDDPYISFMLTQEAEVFASRRPREFKIIELIAPQSDGNTATLFGSLLRELAELQASGIGEKFASSLVINFVIPIGESMWPSPQFAAVVESEFDSRESAQEFHSLRQGLASASATRELVDLRRTVVLATKPYDLSPVH